MKLSSLLIVNLLFVTSFTQASEGLKIKDAWVPQAPPVAKVMAGYLEVENETKTDITIQSVSSPVFNSVEMHETVHEKGLAKMIRQTTLTIPANKEIKFQRGGLHLMLFKPKQPLKLNDEIDIEFKTDRGTYRFRARVKQATLEDDHSHHHHH